MGYVPKGQDQDLTYVVAKLLVVKGLDCSIRLQGQSNQLQVRLPNCILAPHQECETPRRLRYLGVMRGTCRPVTYGPGSHF